MQINGHADKHTSRHEHKHTYTDKHAHIETYRYVHCADTHSDTLRYYKYGDTDTHYTYSEIGDNLCLFFMT